MVLLSIFAFLCPPMWSHDENVDCPHLYQLIMGSYTLIVGVLKYFLIFGGFVRFDFDPLVLSAYGTFVHFCFSLSAHVMAWRECWLSTPGSCDHLIVCLDCWSIKIFSHFWSVLSALILILWGLRLMVLLSNFAFLCPPKWLHDWECWLSTPVSGDHGLVHLDCWSIKIFSHFWGFCPLWFWSFGSFVLWCFCPFLLSLSAHVIAWWECWLSTPVSCDHLIVRLDCWSIKTFSHFWGFCPLWFWSFGSFVLWCFYPFLLFSVRPCDRMTRMLIIHTCIIWSFDRAPWLLEY